MTRSEKHKLITKTLAKKRQLRKSLLRQYEGLRDLTEDDPRWKARFVRFERTAERLNR